MVQSDFGEKLVRLEEKVTQLEGRLGDAETEMKVTSTYVVEQKALQTSQHQQNSRKLNWIMTFSAVATAIAGYLAIFLSRH